MTKDPLYNQLRELSWRRKLTDAEEAQLRTWLRAHPEAGADLETETALNEVLGGLPDAPVPSNFTARVLQALDRDDVAELRRQERRGRFWRRLRWLPRLGFAAVILTAGLVSYHQIQTAHQTQLVQSVAIVSGVSTLPSRGILQDFDAIQALNATPPADVDLLAALK